MNEGILKNAVLAKTDAIIKKIMGFCAYLAGFALIVMAVWATVNVIYSKTTMNSIPATTEWISYLLVPSVFLAVGVEIVQSGLISVDLITERFPKAIQKLIIAVGYVIGAALSALMCQQQFLNMMTLFKSKKVSTIDKLGFQVWPFSLIIMVGMAMMAVAMVWYVICTFAKKEEVAVTEGDNVENEVEEIQARDLSIREETTVGEEGENE